MIIQEKRKCKYCDREPEIKQITYKGILYKNTCSQHKGYKKYKKDVCEKCGFIPIDKVQLDIHHKDGNSKNHIESNLITICANCHRLITFKEKHYARKN